MAEVVPSKNDIQAYFYTVFGHLGGFIPLRSFAEKGNEDTVPVPCAWVVTDDEMTTKALTFARTANKRNAAFYVIPGTVGKVGQAGSTHVTEMQVLLIDIDEGDTECKLLEMTAAIGKPSMVVESGGIT